MFAKKFFVSALVAVAFLAGNSEAVAGPDDPQDRIVKRCPPEDIDCDGKANDFDDCPDVPGAKSTCGCPDVDGDMFPEDVGQCSAGTCPETKCSGSFGQVNERYQLLIDLCPPPAGMSAKEFEALGRDRDRYLETGNNILDLDGCPGPFVNEDGDTSPDSVDQCRELFGSNKGCPGPDHDSDNDGVRNVDDKCPLIPAIFTETKVADAYLEPGCPEDPYEAIYGARAAEYFGRKGLDKDRKVRIEVARKSVAKPGIEVVWGGSTSGAERPKASKQNDRDADNIPDDKDKCPDEKEDFKYDPDPLNLDGCPGEPAGGEEVASSPKPSESGEREGVPLIIGGEVELEDIEKPEPSPKPPLAVPGDEDGDGAVGDKDKCPKVSGDPTFNGCPPELDTDQDGQPDWLDDCPSEAEDKDGLDDHDGCPDELDPASDTDGDGVDAINDRCPDVKGDPLYSGCPLPEEKKVAEATPAPEPPKAEPEPVPVPVVEPDHDPVPSEPKPEEKKPEPPPAEKVEPPKPEFIPELPTPEPTIEPPSAAPVVEKEAEESPPALEPEPDPEPTHEPEPSPDPSAAPSEPADDRDEGIQPWSMGPCPVQDQPVNYIWTGAVGAVPPVGTSTCPAGKIPGVMGTADPITGGRRGQDDLDGRRATRTAPPDWDGGWCSLGVTTILGNSVAIGCVEPLSTSVGLPSMGDFKGKVSDEVGRQLAGLPLPPDLTDEVGDLEKRVSVFEAAKSLVDWSAYPTVGVRLLPGVAALSLGAGLTFVDDWFVAEFEVAYTRARGTYFHDYGVEAGFRPFGVRVTEWLDVLSAIRVGQYSWAPFTLWRERQWGAGVAVSIRPFGDLIELDAELLGGEGWFPSSLPFTGHIQATGQVTLRLNLGADPK